MSDEEVATNTQMDVDAAPNDSSSSPAPGVSTGMLDLGIGSGYISGSDDEDVVPEAPASKSSTPDSTTLPKSTVRKPLSSKKHPLTKNKSALVTYERDSDDDEHSEDEESNGNDHDQDDDDESNSNSGPISIETGGIDPVQQETTLYTKQMHITSDLSNAISLRTEEASPSSHGDMTPNHASIFAEDADIRIPPQASKSCSVELERKFEECHKRFKRDGVDQNMRIQKMRDFRNPCMYEKLISRLGIDEIGTNFPQELYDPHWWGQESYYEELSKAQRLEMERREKQQRERTKIGFTPGVKKMDQLGVFPSSTNETVVEKRKNRFDQ